MSLADAIAANQPPSTKCAIGRILDTVDKRDATALNTILADPNWTATRICTIIRGEGHPVGRDTITAHRNGKCACGTR